MLPFRQMVYVEDRDEYMPEDEVPDGSRVLNISGTEQRRRLNEGKDLPAWFTPPAVAAELRRSYPPRSHQGVTVFFTGLSGSGKSTIASALLVKLLEIGGRPVSLLDGDLVRKHLSSELGFSKEHPRPEHSAHRLRGRGDHQERRPGGVRADRSIRRHPARRAAHGRGRRGVCPRTRRDPARGV